MSFPFIHPDIKTETLPLSRVSGRLPGGRFNFSAAKPTKTYRFTGTPGEFLSVLHAMAQSPENRALKRELESRSGEWSGLGPQNAAQVAQEGYSSAALQAFQKATAALGVSKARGTPQLAPCGTSYSMARVIQGHPIAAFKRPREKLPPVSLDLTVNAWCGRKPEDIQNSLAKIARAAWDYQAAGGPVSITVHYLYYFSEARNGHMAFMASLKIPLSNGAQFATGASLQMFRGPGMAIAGSCLSGEVGDGLPLAKWDNPKTLPISGDPAEDAEILAALKIA